MNFTEQERWTLINALRVAASQFRKDSQTMSMADQPQLAEQFVRQAIEVLTLANKIENDE